MPKFSVSHKSQLPASEVLKKVKDLFENDADIRRLDSNLKTSFDPSGKGSITGSQFKAEILVKEETPGSNITITVDLPLLLTPFKAKVQEMVQKKLSKYLV